MLFLVVQNNLGLNWLRYLLLIPIPIMLKLLIETGSRVSLISFVLMIIVGFYYVKKSGFFIKFFLFLALTAVAFFIYNFIFENQLILLRLISSIDDKDLAGRDLIFSEIWDVVKHNFIFGIGQDLELGENEVKVTIIATGFEDKDYEVEKLRYDCDWNWLIPVVNRIRLLRSTSYNKDNMRVVVILTDFPRILRYKTLIFNVL